ncbi:hypothetical protein [Bradyrhizobium sp. STM 3561]|uniref:hypothetical protein n=1 Tax=Bradyrhizobium sp. STM 3561 TaxID=578923 RepID=UPI0038906696
MLSKMKVPARHLLRGDIVGSGEVVIAVSTGSRTPRGKIEVLLEKNDRRRIALWGAGSTINIQRETVKMKTADTTQEATAIPLSDRLPTFHELASFDAGKAWDCLTPEQQREIGIIALRFGTVGQCEEYFHETIEEVRKGFMSSHWTPQVQETAVWPRLQIQLIESAAREAFQTLCDHFDPMWPQLFGWAAGKEVTQP